MPELEGEYVPTAADWVNEQVFAYQTTGGKEGNTLFDTGYPVVIVTIRGAKTGFVRKIALMRVEHEGEYALVASYGGHPTNPTWYANLVTHPDEVLVQDGPEPVAVTVRELEGDERQLWWDRSVAAYPDYAVYQQHTDRLIPVFLATPT